MLQLTVLSLISVFSTASPILATTEDTTICYLDFLHNPKFQTQFAECKSQEDALMQTVNILSSPEVIGDVVARLSKHRMICFLNMFEDECNALDAASFAAVQQKICTQINGADYVIFRCRNDLQTSSKPVWQGFICLYNQFRANEANPDSLTCTRALTRTLANRTFVNTVIRTSDANNLTPSERSLFSIEYGVCYSHNLACFMKNDLRRTCGAEIARSYCHASQKFIYACDLYNQWTDCDDSDTATITTTTRTTSKSTTSTTVSPQAATDFSKTPTPLTTTEISSQTSKTTSSVSIDNPDTTPFNLESTALRSTNTTQSTTKHEFKTASSNATTTTTTTSSVSHKIVTEAEVVDEKPEESNNKPYTRIPLVIAETNRLTEAQKAENEKWNVILVLACKARFTVVIIGVLVLLMAITAVIFFLRRHSKPKAASLPHIPSELTRPSSLPPPYEVRLNHAYLSDKEEIAREEMGIIGDAERAKTLPRHTSAQQKLASQNNKTHDYVNIKPGGSPQGGVPFPIKSADSGSNISNSSSSSHVSERDSLKSPESTPNSTTPMSTTPLPTTPITPTSPQPSDGVIQPSEPEWPLPPPTAIHNTARIELSDSHRAEVMRRLSPIEDIEDSVEDFTEEI